MGIFTFPLLVGLFLFERECCQVSPPLFSYRWLMNGYQSELRQKNSTIGDLQCRWFKRLGTLATLELPHQNVGYLCVQASPFHWSSIGLNHEGECSKITSNQWLSPCPYYINPYKSYLTVIRHHSPYPKISSVTRPPIPPTKKKMWRMLGSM